ncbi:unnamed protein product [Blepharisma stoltei]|uniref:Maturase K n=1 Tax=Blepharisma stoltei TaxID=1481888 RepID=A0AAU9KM28_9CILI|nr:unnamed protein product [Blepharisma stoltei]
MTSSMLWVLNYSIQRDSYCIEKILEAKYAPIIINYCDSHYYSIALPSLKPLGNISSRNIAHELLCLSSLVWLMSHQNKSRESKYI